MSNPSKNLSRRHFIKKSVGYLAASGLAAATPIQLMAQDVSAPPKDIPIRTLGKTGLKIPILSMGVGVCENRALVKACYDAGMRLFDTAPNYGFGRNEQMLGTALQKLGIRKEVIIGTKTLTPAQRNGATPEQVMSRVRTSVEASLKQLKTDYIDILYLHDLRSKDDAKIEAVNEAMVTMKKEGKARFIGTSSHADVANVVLGAIDAKIYDVVLAGFNFTTADPPDVVNALKKAHAAGIGVIVMKTQAGGSNFPNPETLRNYSAQVINSAALKWVLNNEYICTAIPGVRNYDHVRANVAAAYNLVYTEEESSFLSDNNMKLGMGFCRQCRQCLASCPENTEIPDLMRSHMYTTQYADFKMARSTLNEIPRGRDLSNCISCDNCVAQCASGRIDIPNKIGDLKSIYA